jgi:hypothetical protein
LSGWIKVEKSLDDDPRVLRMASRLRNADVTLGERTHALVVGALVRFWWYADTHIRADDTLDLGKNEIDNLVGVPGFCDLMPDDWLRVVDESTVELPGFQTHNGVEAKRRALVQKRVTRHRDKSNAVSVTPAYRSALPDQTRPDQDHKRGGSARASSSAPPVEDEHHAQFERLQAAYPKFAGRANWVIAEGHCRSRIEQGATWAELTAAVERYAAYVGSGGASTTQHVMRPETFFSASDEPWRQRWDPPEPITGDLNGRGPLPPRPTRFEQLMGKEEVVIVDGP